MTNSVDIRQKWKDFTKKAAPFFGAVDGVLRKIGEVMDIIWLWIMRLRKIFLAIPVLYAAIKLAKAGFTYLPEQVGINLLSNGEFAMLAERSVAVYGPFALTMACLLLMFCSRRTLYPWIISLFTLVLPVLILAMNNLDGALVVMQPVIDTVLGLVSGLLGSSGG